MAALPGLARRLASRPILKCTSSHGLEGGEAIGRTRRTRRGELWNKLRKERIRGYNTNANQPSMLISCANTKTRYFCTMINAEDRKQVVRVCLKKGEERQKRKEGHRLEYCGNIFHY
ncbi:hypothetical protein ABW19_dt0205575 [Dactylella cylindrospora]|nr:hypothetical protein ABW19_dt0205575 [Dactylella cylindrospora]